jgi:iron complex outermembrane receptor protein
LPSDDLLFAPGVSAAWWPTQTIRIHTSAGHSYRAPTWTERFYRDPVNIGNASLSVERAWSGDVGLDLYPVSTLRFSGSVFIRDATDMIDWARPVDGSDPIWRTRNVDDARFRGIEAEVDVMAIAGTRIRARGAWLSLESSAAPGFSSKYALRPEVESVSLAADRNFFDLLHLSIRGARERRVGEANHIRLDSRASIQAGQVRLYLDLLNASDADYLDISGIPVAGRNAVLGLELRR